MPDALIGQGAAGASQGERAYRHGVAARRTRGHYDHSVDPLRIIDADVNRAREALRTAEEAARFLLEDATLAAEAKDLRNAVAAVALALESAVGRPLASARDTPGDVGTRLQGAGESRRDGAAGVVRAATDRLSESLRAIEEWTKAVPEAVEAGIPPRVETLRYRGYELQRRLLGALTVRRRPQWRLCVLITEAACRGGDWLGVAAAAVAAGADCLQLREPELGGGDLLARGRRLRQITGDAGVALVVNDRPDVALACGADGVHLGQSDLPADAARRLAGDRLLIGVSTSRIQEARAALAAGADLCGVGPMHASGTKHKDHIVGPAYLADYLAWGRLPHLAIGGIDATRAEALAAAGARGVAVCGAVAGADDPAAATRAILAAMATAATEPVS